MRRYRHSYLALLATATHLLADFRRSAGSQSRPRPQSVQRPNQTGSTPGLGPAHTGPLELLRDLDDLSQLATLVASTWELVGQAAHGTCDRRSALLGIICKKAPLCVWWNASKQSGSFIGKTPLPI